MPSGIYVIENLVNGKKYVGQSVTAEERMKKNHVHCNVLNFAIEKYGIENFKSYVIESCPIEKLDEMEVYWIKELRSHVSEWGYNVFWGGNVSARGTHKSEEWRKEASARMSGENNHRYGTHPSQETIEKQRLVKIGTHRSNETKMKMSNAQKISQYVGVFVDYRLNDNAIIWKYCITEDGKRRKIAGGYKKDIDAAKAYDKYVVEHNINYSLNFPEDYPNYPLFLEKQ